MSNQKATTVDDVSEKAVSEDVFNEETKSENTEVEVSSDDDDDDGARTPTSFMDAVDSDDDGVPEWVSIPSDLVIPPGRKVFYLRFRSRWTNAPHKGDRVCIVWSPSDAEENKANDRAQNSQYRFLKELAKISIRAIDGYKADWSGKPGKPGNVSEFWNEIGPKGRALIQNIHLKSATLVGEDLQDFLSHCVAANTAMPG